MFYCDLLLSFKKKVIINDQDHNYSRMALFELFTLGIMYLARGWITFRTRGKISKLCKFALLFFFLCVVGGAGFEIWMYVSGNRFSSTSCPVVPNMTRFTLSKDPTSQYNWKYFIPNTQIVVKQKCPTPNNEPALYYGPLSSLRMIARVNKEQFSLYNTAQIMDCMGHVIFAIETDSLKQTFLNNIGVHANVLFRGFDNSVIGYTTGTSLYVNQITIYDAISANASLVATINQLSATSWTWSINIYIPSHPVADLRLLILLAGMISFSDPIFGSTDICNNLFYYLGYILLGITIVSVLAFVAGCVRTIILRRATEANSTPAESKPVTNDDSVATEPSKTNDKNDTNNAVIESKPKHDTKKHKRRTAEQQTSESDTSDSNVHVPETKPPDRKSSDSKRSNTSQRSESARNLHKKKRHVKKNQEEQSTAV
jgi:hypothetical protein